MIQAKPIVPDQYWILRRQDQKIGNIECDGQQYVVSIGSKRRSFQDLRELADSVGIVFEPGVTQPDQVPTQEAYGFPTTSTAYNVVFDVLHRVPLWTTEPRSRSWYAAGWYRVRQHRSWRIMHCPKLIILQRYEYQGPYHSLQEAQNTTKTA